MVFAPVSPGGLADYERCLIEPHVVKYCRYIRSYRIHNAMALNPTSIHPPGEARAASRDIVVYFVSQRGEG